MKKVLGFGEYLNFSSKKKLEESSDNEFLYGNPIFEEGESGETGTQVDFSELLKGFSNIVKVIGDESKKEKLKGESESAGKEKNSWSGISTGFKDKTEGDLFRKWMKKKHSDFKSSEEKILSDSSEFFDNSVIREAYGKYKGEYGFSQKESEDFRKWWRSDEDRKKKEFEVDGKKDSVGDKGNSTSKVLLLAYNSEKSKWDEEWKKNNKKDEQTK